MVSPEFRSYETWLVERERIWELEFSKFQKLTVANSVLGLKKILPFWSFEAIKKSNVVAVESISRFWLFSGGVFCSFFSCFPPCTTRSFRAEGYLELCRAYMGHLCVITEHIWYAPAQRDYRYLNLKSGNCWGLFFLLCLICSFIVWTFDIG